MVGSALVLLLIAAPHAAAVPSPPAPPTPAPPAAPGAGAHRAGDWGAKRSGKTVTIEGGTTLDDALGSIAGAAGWNLVANTGSVGARDLSVRLRDVPVEEALDAVLQGTSLVATRTGATVTVAPGRTTPVERVPPLAGFDRPTGKRFSGDFDEERVDAALRKVADAGGLSVVFPPGLRGTVTGHFKDAPVEDVLRALLGQAGMTGRREGSVLTVSREGGASVVIRGGKRSVSFDVPDFQAEVDDALRGARDARERAREAARIAREARKEARKEARDAVRAGRGDGKGHVVHGDQVIGPGERADEVVAIRGSVRVESGATAQQVVAILGSVDLAPGVNVDGDVVAIGGDVHVGPGAHVGGDAVSVGGKLVIDDTGVVEGEQTSVDVPGLTSMLSLVGARSSSMRRSAALSAATGFAQFAVLFALGLLFLWVAPRRLEMLTGAVVQAPLKTVLTGIVGTLAIPIAGILLAVTVVGIPLIAVLVLAIAAGAVMGYAALALFVGRALPFRFERGTAILQLAIGTALLVAVGKIPVLGPLAWIAAWMFVLGIVLRTRFGRPPVPPPPVYGTTAPPSMPPPMPPPATGTTGG